MELQEFYQELTKELQQGRLTMNPELGEGVLLELLFATQIQYIEKCSIVMQQNQVVIDGMCKLYEWNQGGLFDTRILCRQQGEKLVFQASFWCGFQGSLGTFFGNIAPARLYDENGLEKIEPLLDDFQIAQPILSYDSSSSMEYLPLQFSAAVREPKGSIWKPYAFLLQGIGKMTGKLNGRGIYEFEIPLESMVSGIFSCSRTALILRSGIRNRGNLLYNVISQVGGRLTLELPQLKTVEFTLPLFMQYGHWSLQAYFPQGMDIADIVNFLLELFGIGGSSEALFLPSDTALNQFKLYRMNMFARQEQGELSTEYMMLEFALANPWQLPFFYITLERLNVGFEVTFGSGADRGDLLTASAGGTLSVTLGSYQLKMNFEMQLPERSFLAQITLREKADGPGMKELADTFQVVLPQNWQEENNLLGQITVYGSVSARSFAIEAGVYNLLTFSIGDLEFTLTSIEAGAEVMTSHFTFWVQGSMEYGEGADAFSLFTKAVYNNPGWVFSGGLSKGEVNVGELLSKMFHIAQPAADIFSLKVTELLLSYATEKERFELTAAFEAGWNVVLLGKEFILGGKIRVLQEEQKETDIVALAYFYLGDFRLLAEVGNVQSLQDRSYLFRVEYNKLFLQAAWFRRKNEEILSVSLGGMNLGNLIESLVNLVNPNRRYTLNSPWNLLNKIDLAKFLLEFNVTGNQVFFLYQADLNIAGLMYIEKVGIQYDMEAKKLFFVLTGELLGITYGEGDPITWDILDGKPPANSANNEKKFHLSYLGLGQHLKNDGLLEADNIEAAVKALREQLNPSTISGGVSYDARTNWLFGADFTINGMLNVKLVLNDPVLYGILVTVNAKQGSVLELLDGLGIELLCKKVSSDVYMFRGELLVPKRYRRIQLGVVTLILGTIRAEIYTNGGFYVDLGFPHDLDFSRSFVLEWGIFTGRGGIYFGVMKNVSVPHLPEVINGNFSPIVTLGLGLSVGLGRSFDLGIAKGGVSLEVYGILEGVLAFFHNQETEEESTYYYVKGAVGIVGRLYLSVDFKIITIQALAQIKASAALTIQAYRASLVEVELSLELQASIRILFIKIRFSFSFHQKVTFQMGSDEQAPWIEKEKYGRIIQKDSGFRIGKLQAVELGTEQIHLSMLPVFYLYRPSLEEGAEKQYGVAFLMMMGQAALKQWAGLLSEWVLSACSKEMVSWEWMEQLSPTLADSVTYEELEEFLKKNVMITYDIHWTEQERNLRNHRLTEEEGFVFPMLPSLTLSFDGMQVNYWEETPVGEDYFNMLTEYFSQLNPDPSQATENKEPLEEQDATQSVLPVAKAFFLDYFRMFLREVIREIKDKYEQITEESGVCSGAQKYGISVTEILRRNPDLIFASGAGFTFPSLTYVTIEGDSLNSICKKFNYNEKVLWQKIQQEPLLLQKGSSFLYGEEEYDNELSQFTLLQAASFLFVRFYEESIPDNLFYAGEIVQLNEGLDMDWRETNPGGRELVLPRYEKAYCTMRGDTPERIGKYLYVLETDRNELLYWKEFYEYICEKNRAQAEDIPSQVYFQVSQVSVNKDINLADLADRIYPDYEEENPGVHLWEAGILKINTPIVLSDVAVAIGDSEKVTVKDLMGKLPCTVEELGQAVLEDSVFMEKQQIVLDGLQQMNKKEIRALVEEKADTIGAMLSRFLLQGLTIPSPESGFLQGEELLQKDGSSEEELLPVFEVLHQMFLLDEHREDRILTAEASEEGCTWVETEEKQITMQWEQIAERLPDGDFSVLPSAFVQMDDFILSGQYFTLTEGNGFYQGQESFSLYSLPEALQTVLIQGQAEPLLVDEKGEHPDAVWGCLIPIAIGTCSKEGVFGVYGADSHQRLALHRLLSISNLSVQLIYQMSAVSKGEQNFWGCGWSSERSFLVRTNLSVETHMGYLHKSEEEAKQNIVTLKQPEKLLRMLWECSTVSSKGFYLSLETKDGQTLPADIFDEQGRGTLWVLAQGQDYASLSGCVNCCMLKTAFRKENMVTLVTQDAKQERPQPVFPAGCVGLFSKMADPVEENLSEKREYMRSLFQITGYQILENDNFEQSHISAPLLPEKVENDWYYHTAVPMYRYGKEQTGIEEKNPYLSVGKTGKVALEMRDILGNTLRIGETQITPYYNDILIGIGQYPAAKVSYAIITENGVTVVRLTFHTLEQENPGEESVRYQKRAAMQLACEDIQVTLSSPVNEEEFSFRELKKEEKSYLELLREYVNSLAEAMEKGMPFGAAAESLSLDFPLHIEAYPMPAEIFLLKTVITISRAEELVQDPAAQKTTTVVFPAAYELQDTEEEKNLQMFCRDAMAALKTLYLAQSAESKNVLYGITHGEKGFLKKLDVSVISYAAETMDGKVQIVEAPEFYALSPVCNRLLSREARVRSMAEDFSLSEEFGISSFSDVDMEIWVKQFLEDVEQLLAPEPVKKFGQGCQEALNHLINTKEKLAQAISCQMSTLRKKGPAVSRDLKERVADRLKKSLTEGYNTDIAGVFRLDFQIGQDEKIRLTAVSQHNMVGTQAAAGKPENGKEEFVIFFTNSFTGKNIPLKTNLLFTELEYDIQKDIDGYESSKWLRFVEPITLEAEEGLESQLALPNPLRACPQPPGLENHICKLDLVEKKTNVLKLRTGEGRIGWDYILDMRYFYKEQDTFFIKVIFESLPEMHRDVCERDLFDILAEYSLHRDAIRKKIVLENEYSDRQKKAYESFVDIAIQAAEVWEAWAIENVQGTKRKVLNEQMVYSCTAEGICKGDKLEFQVKSTEEGLEFLKRFGLEETEPYIEVVQSGSEREETELLFIMKQLPLFSCAQAEPIVKIIRNRNILSGADEVFAVAENFIYQTQEVSLRELPVTGEYTQEFRIASIPFETITKNIMAQAVRELLDVLQLENKSLMVELSVSYYYGLHERQSQPRVRLPVTFLPCVNIMESGGNTDSFIDGLADNLYQWYQQVQPVANQCGLIFDIRIYQKSGDKLLLHFSNLEVGFEKCSNLTKVYR